MAIRKPAPKSIQRQQGKPAATRGPSGKPKFSARPTNKAPSGTTRSPSTPIRQNDPSRQAAMDIYNQLMQMQANNYLAQAAGDGQLDSDKSILQQESDFYANNLNQNIVNKAKQEYLASLPSDMRYAQALTPTRYGGTFGDRRGQGFDQWFTENYINKGLIQVPSSPRDSQGPMPGINSQNAIYNQLMQQQMANYAAQYGDLVGSIAQPGKQDISTQYGNLVKSISIPNQSAAQNFANVATGIAGLTQPGMQSPAARPATRKQLPQRPGFNTQGFNPPIRAF